MDNQSGYCRVVREVRVNVLDRLLLHFISKSNYFRKKNESPAKAVKAAKRPSQYFS
jgi:hypothetical protein